jgi:hypothetical protein
MKTQTKKLATVFSPRALDPPAVIALCDLVIALLSRPDDNTRIAILQKTVVALTADKKAQAAAQADELITTTVAARAAGMTPAGVRLLINKHGIGEWEVRDRKWLVSKRKLHSLLLIKYGKLPASWAEVFPAANTLAVSENP